MAAAPGRLTEAYESGGAVASVDHPRAQAGNAAARRPASTSTRPSWKRDGKAACFYVHAPKLEARRQGGLLLRPRAQAGSATARRPASTSTRPSWKRGGKAACFYVHAPKLEARRQGGWLLRPRAQAGSAAARWPASTSHAGKRVAKGSLRRCLSERRRSGGIERPASTPDRQRGSSTRPSWKRGGKVACCGRTGDA